MAEREQPTLLFNNGGKLYSLAEGAYADYAKKLMEAEAGRNDRKGLFGGLTTTKLRGIYAHIVNLYTKIDDQEAFAKSKGDIQYLKVKLAYEAGRMREVKDFLDKTHLMDMLDRVNAYDEYLLYCRYAESLVAFFKFYGGKE
ncbi:type III-A CRISPR-associated protein Csm2 [Gordonibacter sp. An230]|uniref:type III-A CRISPR-associated protein Csm2 n=1 Tax=Gordonibacter sp. An230 TaxID=1965592 RepID=UPI000B3978C5|nr:type III-A CRISPR-associated protein Csm2 [Gordonibacter sp. An230]OUO91765.1 type III-A CRISPR-associated protein Csm2 [Gordonibacter sp. An230]